MSRGGTRTGISEERCPISWENNLFRQLSGQDWGGTREKDPFLSMFPGYPSPALKGGMTVSLKSFPLTAPLQETVTWKGVGRGDP